MWGSNFVLLPFQRYLKWENHSGPLHARLCLCKFGITDSMGERLLYSIYIDSNRRLGIYSTYIFAPVPISQDSRCWWTFQWSDMTDEICCIKTQVSHMMYGIARMFEANISTVVGRPRP